MEPQAVIGFSFKLPGGIVDEDSLWDVLESRRNLVTNWPANRTSIDSFSSTSGNTTNKVHTNYYATYSDIANALEASHASGILCGR